MGTLVEELPLKSESRAASKNLASSLIVSLSLLELAAWPFPQ